MDFFIGQIFDDDYPPEAADWCNKRHDCHIDAVGDGEYRIVENSEQDAPFDRSTWDESVDDALCELYETALAQSDIMDEQDAAICALYEMIGE